MFYLTTHSTHFLFVCTVIWHQTLALADVSEPTDTNMLICVSGSQKRVPSDAYSVWDQSQVVGSIPGGGPRSILWYLDCGQLYTGCVNKQIIILYIRQVYKNNHKHKIPVNYNF